LRVDGDVLEVFDVRYPSHHGLQEGALANPRWSADEGDPAAGCGKESVECSQLRAAADEAPAPEAVQPVPQRGPLVSSVSHLSLKFVERDAIQT
jgi:hypothetical protein